MPFIKSHSGKRIMKDDTDPNYLWNCYNRVTKATVKGVISFWAARQRGTCPVKRWAGLLYLLVRDTSSHAHDHIIIVLGLSLPELVQNGCVLLSQTTYLLKELSLCNLPLPFSSELSKKSVLDKRQTTDSLYKQPIDYTFNGFRVHKAMEFGF